MRQKDSRLVLPRLAPAPSEGGTAAAVTSEGGGRGTSSQLAGWRPSKALLTTPLNAVLAGRGGAPAAQALPIHLQGRAHGAVLHIWSETAFSQRNWFFVPGMQPELLWRRPARGVCHKVDSAIQSYFKDMILLQRDIRTPHFNIRTKAPNGRRDHVARLGMRADVPGK